jgi:hypothetical protein
MCAEYGGPESCILKILKEFIITIYRIIMKFIYSHVCRSSADIPTLTFSILGMSATDVSKFRLEIKLLASQQYTASACRSETFLCS